MDDITKAILDNYDTQIESSEVVMKYFIEKKRKYMEKNNIIEAKKEDMNLEEFNELCDDMIKKYHVDTPLTESDATDKYLNVILCDLVSNFKGFSNSEKGVPEIGIMHKVCRNMFMIPYDKYLNAVDSKLLSKVWRITFEFVCIEVPSPYAALRANNSIYSMSNPMLWHDESNSKKSSINSILSALDMFDSYILAHYVDMGGSIVIGKKKRNG